MQPDDEAAEPMTIDELMDLDPLSLTKTSPEIDAIILWHRQQRARIIAGEKPRKPKKEGIGEKIDLLKIGLKKVEAPIKRRF